MTDSQKVRRTLIPPGGLTRRVFQRSKVTAGGITDTGPNRGFARLGAADAVGDGRRGDGLSDLERNRLIKHRGHNEVRL